MTTPATPIDVYASATQYVDHMAPVWKALRKKNRGTFHVKPESLERALALGLPATLSPLVPSSARPILVASSGNLNYATLRGRMNSVIMEHGAGQSYGGVRGVFAQVARESSSYAGGAGRTAKLFLHPGEHPAARDRARYPEARVEVIGCPKLDTLPKRVPGGLPTVAFSFHWDATIIAEARSCFIFYREHLANLAKAADRLGIRVVAHSHPRYADIVRPWYKRKGIEFLETFDEVCRQADVYACDNSSTIFEFASTGRPVIVLNGPFYRREALHGLRFWEDATIGEQVDEPYDIEEVVMHHIRHPFLWAEQREKAVNHVYAFRTGAAARAARVLEDWAASL